MAFVAHDSLFTPSPETAALSCIILWHARLSESAQAQINSADPLQNEVTCALRVVS